MATSQVFALADNSTLANFKAWAQALSNAFSTFGWVKSSDTGQVNFSSISTAPAASTFVYEVWTMNDSLSTSNPVFVKVEYGSGGTTSIPSMAITVGSGSNGAGTLTNANTRQIIGGATSGGGTTTTFECDMSGAAGRISFIMFRGFTFPMFFSIERSHDTNGNDTSSYVSILMSGNGVSPAKCGQQTILPQANGGPLNFESLGLTVQTSNTTATFANSTAVAPFWPFVGKLDNPLMGAVCMKTGDFSDGAQFGVQMYGASHNFIVIKSSLGSWANQTTNSIAMRYE